MEQVPRLLNERARGSTSKVDILWPKSLVHVSRLRKDQARQTDRPASEAVPAGKDGDGSERECTQTNDQFYCLSVGLCLRSYFWPWLDAVCLCLYCKYRFSFSRPTQNVGLYHQRRQQTDRDCSGTRCRQGVRFVFWPSVQVRPVGFSWSVIGRAARRFDKNKKVIISCSAFRLFFLQGN